MNDDIYNMERYDKIEYIKDNKKYLNRNDLINIRNIIIEQNANSIDETLNGIRIDLNILSDATIDILYKFVDVNSRM